MLKAPSKELIWFEQSAHMVNSEETSAFNRVLVERIRPTILTSSDGNASAEHSDGPLTQDAKP